MELLAFILVDGLIYGAWLFIVSVGLTLVFGVLNILNLAHGSLYAIGAYTTASAVGVYFALGGDAFPMGSYIAMILGALLVALVLGPLLERGLLRHFYDRDHVIVVLVTYGVFLILEDVMKLIWGVTPLFVSEPYSPRQCRTGSPLLCRLRFLGHCGCCCRWCRRLVRAEPNPARQGGAGGYS